MKIVTLVGPRRRSVVSEMSSRQVLFLELCGTTFSGMSSGYFENICKPRPHMLGHEVIIPVSLIQAVVQRVVSQGSVVDRTTHHLIGHIHKHTYAPENVDHSSV